MYKNLYLGAELGISFESGKSPNYYYDNNSSVVSWNSQGTETSSKYINYSGETNTTVTTTTSGNTTNIETTNGIAKTK